MLRPMAERNVSAGTVMLWLPVTVRNSTRPLAVRCSTATERSCPGTIHALGGQRALQIALADLAAPLVRAAAHTIGVGVLLQIRRALLVVAENVVAVFGRPAAVRVIVGRRRLAVIPQHFTGGGFGDLAAAAASRPASRRFWQCVESQKSKPSSACRLPKCMA